MTINNNKFYKNYKFYKTNDILLHKLKYKNIFGSIALGTVIGIFIGTTLGLMSNKK